MFDKRNNPRIDLQLHILGKLRLFLLLVYVLKVEPRDASLRNDVGPQQESHHCNDGSRNHIRAHQALEAHPGGHHGDNLRILCQFGGEEYHRDEHEQRTEQVGKIGDEVGVVLENDTFPRGMVGRKLIDILIEVEHHGNGNNQCNGKEICTQKLLDKIHIQLGNETFIPLHIQSFFNYSRAATRFTIEAFQEAKSPVMIWRRASRVNHK